MKEEYNIRIEAIKRFLARERPASNIYRSLNKNRQWFYFWLRRYQIHDDNWYKDRPKVNRTIHNKIDKNLEILICNIRNKLTQTKYAQIGAWAIQWELKNLGIKPLPIWTINRIIKRNNLVKKPKIFEKRNKLYPYIKLYSTNILHQLDIVGPRYLSKGKKFFSFNLIDAFSNIIKIKAYPGKRGIFVTDSLVSAWQVLGIPKYLQVDNGLSFKGSNRHPRTFGVVIKLCLYLGVEIIFIPEAEPWRQGVIEKFNDVYDKMFFRVQIFSDLAHLNEESLVFENFHNHNHCYSKLKGRTPYIIHRSKRKILLSKNFDLHKGYIPFKDGKVSFIRLTNKEGKVRFFSETFLVDKDLVHEYVKGTIFTKSGLLKFYYDKKVIKIYNYEVNRH
jgi:transposase InsO family protein